jgi:hypothetical protein
MNLMNAGKKALLAATAAALIASSPPTQAAAAPAQAAHQQHPSLEERVRERAQRLAEQRLPRTAVSFDPKQFDKYVGIYQLEQYQFIALTREGEHFFGAPVGQEDQKLELYPESPIKFFSKAMSRQISFAPDAKGKVSGLVMHVKGFEIPSPKVGEAAAKAAAAELVARIKNKTRSPGTEEALRRYIATFQNGQPNYDALIPIEQLQAYEQAPAYAATLQKLGALTSLTFVAVMPNGFDKYLGVFEHGRAEMTVEPLSPDGKTAGVRIGKAETL